MISFPCKEKSFYYNHKKFDSVISYLLFVQLDYQHNKMLKTSESKYIMKLSFISTAHCTLDLLIILFQLLKVISNKKYLQYFFNNIKY